MTTSDYGSRGAAPHSGTGQPDNAQELRQEIEDARERLGDTVQELAARADVTARARHKAAEKDQLKAGAGAVAAPVWEATPEPVRQALTKGANAVRQRRAPLAVAASAAFACWLVVRWSRRR